MGKSYLKVSEKNEDFFDRVYQLVRQIPEGKVTSYGAIAQCLGMKRGARMVGWAMNKSHSLKEPVPAHRVVNRNGMLTGKHHFKNPFYMQKMLEKEGLKVKNDQIINFRDCFWDPYKELGLE